MEKLSTSEKWKFLGALYKHGCEEEHLSTELDDWSEEKIQKAVKSYRARAIRHLNSSQSESDADSIDMWFDLIGNCHKIEGTVTAGDPSDEDLDWKDYSFLLSKCLFYTAGFEEHYQGETPDDPNFNEIYRYLAQLLAGEEPTQLRPANAHRILDMMARLRKLINNKESVQRYLNYISDQHSVSYLQPGVDVWKIVEEKKKMPREVQRNEMYQLFTDADDGSDSTLLDLATDDPHYIVKKEKISLKLSLKQRALASTLVNIPGMNPLEMVLPSLVKPPASLTQGVPASNPRKRKFKSEENQD